MKIVMKTRMTMNYVELTLEESSCIYFFDMDLVSVDIHPVIANIFDEAIPLGSIGRLGVVVVRS